MHDKIKTILDNLAQQADEDNAALLIGKITLQELKDRQEWRLLELQNIRTWLVSTSSSTK